MRISLIADVFGEHNNGTSITASRLVENMKARGHHVTVVSPYRCDEPGYVSMPRRRFPIFNDYIERNGVSFCAPDETRLRAVIADSDVVHLLLPFGLSRAGLRIARELRVPYTAAFHCQPENITSHLFLLHAKLPNDLCYKMFWDRFYKHVHFVHCPSEFIARQLREHGYENDLRVISNGVVPTFHRRPAERPEALRGRICILFTARYVMEKRHDLLIEAANRSRYRDRIQLIFAGNGPRRNQLIEAGAKLPHPPILRLFSEEELCDVINYSDLYVHASDAEIEAISCIEAFSCGLVPVISDSDRSATNQFALTEHNLFRCGDAQSLADQIDYWIARPQEKAALGERYVEYGRQFAIDACADKMEQMFFDAVQYYRGGALQGALTAAQAPADEKEPALRD